MEPKSNVDTWRARPCFVVVKEWKSKGGIDKELDRELKNVGCMDKKKASCKNKVSSCKSLYAALL